jgi:7-keto-8-aminopelargonate synthetase-like enzyme
MSLALRTIESAVGARIVIDGRPCINFGGSSYLGLASNPEILEAGVEALRAWGSGAPLARDQQVVTCAHQDVEREAASYFGTQAALYVSSGYLFGLIAIAAIRERYTTVFFDERVHYSLREAVAGCGLVSHAYRHLDVDDLKEQLARHLSDSGKPLVVTDGVFATFGEIAPIGRLSSLVAEYGGKVLVDESHAFGVLGASGRGAHEHHGVTTPLVLVGGSLAKAFGVCGGIVPASHDEVEVFRRMPAAVGASGGMAAAAAMCAASLRHVRRHPELLLRLRENVTYAKSGLRRLGVDVPETIVPVATFSVGSQETMQRLQHELMRQGIFVYHTNYVGAGAGGVIRCGIFADHTRHDIDQLLGALQRCI